MYVFTKRLGTLFAIALLASFALPNPANAAVAEGQCKGAIVIAEGTGCDPKTHPVRWMMDPGTEMVERCTSTTGTILSVMWSGSEGRLYFAEGTVPVCGGEPSTVVDVGYAPTDMHGVGDPMDRPVDVSLSHQPSLMRCTSTPGVMLVVFWDPDTARLSFFEYVSNECIGTTPSHKGA